MRKLMVIVLALLVGVALAQPPQIGSIYSRDLSGSLSFVCTVSIVAAEDYGYEDAHDILGLTAAHCVDSGLRLNTDADEWRSNEDFFVTFDEKSFMSVQLLRVGFTNTGYDIALVYFPDTPPDIEPLRTGDWDGVRVGMSILNYANPMGLGVQAFQGYITMLSLDRPVEGARVFWRGNALAMLPSAGGSSGSLIMTTDNEVIGVLIGMIVPRAGSSFTVFVPLSKFDAFLHDSSAGRNVTY